MHRAALVLVVVCRDPSPPTTALPPVVALPAPSAAAPSECATTPHALDRGLVHEQWFHADNGPVGLLVADGTAHGHESHKMGGYLAWDPRSPADPPIAIAGRDCPGFDLEGLRARYRSIVQSYRLLGCDGEATPWKDPKPR